MVARLVCKPIPFSLQERRPLRSLRPRRNHRGGPVIVQDPLHRASVDLLAEAHERGAGAHVDSRWIPGGHLNRTGFLGDAIS